MKKFIYLATEFKEATRRVNRADKKQINSRYTHTRMNEKIRSYIKKINILNDNKDIEGNFILWSFVKLFASIGRLNQAAAALTYNTLFAIVPIMALMLFTASTMGYADTFEHAVRGIFNMETGLSEEILSFTQSYLDYAHSDYWLGAIAGVCFLLYSLFSIYQTIDETFNSLWNLKGRSIKKQLKIFFFTLLIPVIAIILLIVWISISSIFKGGILREINITLLTTGLYIAVLFALYKFIPKVKVRTKYAAISATVCGITFALMQFSASYIWGLFNGFRNIYGSLANILIMLLWVYFSWMICLIGSRWNYLLQESKLVNQKNKYKAISQKYRKFLCLLVLARCEKMAADTADGTFDPLNVATAMSARYKLPAHITMEMVDEMSRIGIITEDEWENKKINEAFDCCTINDMIDALDTTGYNEFATNIAFNAHQRSKERMLWDYMNDKERKDAERYDKPLSTLL